MRSTYRQRSKTSEAGAVLMFGLFLVLLVLVLGALVMDVPRAERVRRQTQQVADGVALVAALQIIQDKSNPSGWLRVKRYILELLPLNALLGVANLRAEIEGLREESPSRPSGDPWDTQETNQIDYSQTEFELPSIFLRIERGCYQAPSDPLSSEGFYSLERFLAGGAENPTVDSVGNCISGECCPTAPKQTYAVANAVRVTLRLKRLATLMAKMPLIGVREFGNVEVTTVAAPEG